LAGYSWLYFSISTNGIYNKTVDVCLIKHVTNIPCPSCGSTRSVVLLISGNLMEAFRINPLGYVVAIILLIAPLWIIIDVLIKRKTLFNFYKKIEAYLKKPLYAIPLILFVLINWIWNVTKGL
jgi:hypothetical protein